MPLEVLNTRMIYTGDHVVIVEKEVRLPTGGIQQKVVIQHPGAVAIVPLTDDGQVILIRQYRLSVGDYLYEIPAGTLEQGEDPRLCAERELQEEAGFFPGTLIPLTGFYVAPGGSTEYIHVFLARDLRPSLLNKDDDEEIEVTVMPMQQALAMITQNEIRDAKTITGLLYAAHLSS
ncbi:MAG: NUDIX hydrolase [Anaerolineae bacterium]|nr:NUDIX hydrolase [Anaerolineae bacterium]